MTDVETALPGMPPPIRALVLLQIYSAARAGELVAMYSRSRSRTVRSWRDLVE